MSSGRQQRTEPIAFVARVLKTSAGLIVTVLLAIAVSGSQATEVRLPSQVMQYLTSVFDTQLPAMVSLEQRPSVVQRQRLLSQMSDVSAGQQPLATIGLNSASSAGSNERKRACWSPVKEQWYPDGALVDRTFVFGPTLSMTPPRSRVRCSNGDWRPE